jgi:hypothetical protein
MERLCRRLPRAWFPKAPVRRLGPGLILLTVSIACGSHDPPSSSLLRLCSEGDQGEVPEFTLRPEWQRGGAGDEGLLLSRVGWATPAPSGGLTFSQLGSPYVLTLNSDGTIRSRIGGTGPGPGEWDPAAPPHVLWHADTLVVTASRGNRMHRFLENGELVESRHVAFPGEDAFSLLQPLRNGAVLGYVRSQPAQGVELLVLRQPDQVGWDSLSTRGRFTYRRDNPTGGFAILLRPFLDTPLRWSAPDGRALVIVDRWEASHPDSAAYRIRVVGDQGETLVNREVCYRPLPLSPEERGDTIQANVARLRDRYPGTPDGALERLVRDVLPLPRFLPPVTWVVMGTSGAIWLRREQTGDGGYFWEIRSAGGDLVGMVRTPEGQVVWAVGGDIVWTVEQDRLEVPIISRHRLVPR